MSCNQSLTPPDAVKKPFQTKEHGNSRVDNYNWMRLSDDQKSTKPFDEQTQNVINYIDEENNYTQKMLSDTDELQNQLFDEIVGRIKKDDESVPYLKNGYYYYRKYEEGKEYPLYCRKKENLDSPEEIMIDGNILSDGYDYFSISGLSVSPNNKILAYSIDTLSRRFYTVYFKNLETGVLLKNSIPNTSGSIAWANNNETIFYASKNKITLKPEKIYKHKIQDSFLKDESVFQELEEEFYTGVYRSKSGKYIIIWNSSTDASDYHILSTDDPDGSFKNFTKRSENHEYSIYHHDDKFYIISNLMSPNNRLMEASTNKTDIKNWKEVLPHREDVHLLELEIFDNHLVLNERIKGLRSLRVINHITGKDQSLDFGENTYTAWISTNKEFKTNILRYGYGSMLTPNSSYDYNMDTGEKILLKQQEVIGGYNADNYESLRLYALSRDGQTIPISLVYNKSMRKKDFQNLLLYAYGSYGSTEDPYFSSKRLSLLDRGFIYAIAHVRGSQIYGRKSYDDGKLLKKKNTFFDFIDVAKYLIDEKYTNKEKLFCSGGSAGGLLIGTVINIEPDLWKGAIAAVPFVDVITTMLDPSIPLTAGEWSEWGDPRIKEFYDYMISYSPYDQVKNKNYPNLLVTSGFFDSQVQYWEPLKWVAKLRDHWKGNNKLLLHMEMEAGHGGKSGRFRAYKETALEYAFLIDLAQNK